MPLKRYIAPTATEALARIRTELGRDALIVSTRTLPPERGAGRGNLIEILVAEGELPPAPPGLTLAPRVAGEVTRVGRMVRDAGGLAGELRQAGIPSGTAALLAQTVAGRLAPGELQELPLVRSLAIAALADRLARGPAPRPRAGRRGRGRILALIGPPGAGKTTVAAKLAWHFARRHRRSAVIVAADHQKEGAELGLRSFAASSGIPFRAAAEDRLLRQSLRELRDVDFTIVDTAGPSGPYGDPQTDSGLLPSLPEEAELHLVLPRTMNSAVAERTIQRYRPLAPTGLILTMLDAGVPLADWTDLLLATPTPLSFLGGGAGLRDGIEVATPHRIAALLLQSLWSSEQES